MKNYYFEGVVTELREIGHRYQVKLQGTEGFCIKGKNDSEDRKFNVIWPKEIDVKNTNDASEPTGTSIIKSELFKEAKLICCDYFWDISTEYEMMLSLVVSNNKRCKFEFTEDSKGNLSIQSITICSE